MATARDGCVVETASLAAVLSGFVSAHNRQRPKTGGRFAGRERRVDVTPVCAVEYLAMETGVPEATVQNVVSQRFRYTELRTADALLAAIERPDLMPPILPNPSASREARAACCSGSTSSLTGA